MSETKVIDIKKLKFDENNFNKHNDEGMELLGKSISQNGYGRSILLDKDNNIVGGNGVTEKAIELGATKVRIIETDGSELIAVKRTDLSLDSKEGREMALADNGVAHVNLEWDTDALAAAEKEWGIVPEDWGVELPDIGLPEELAGEDLLPEELQGIQGDDKTEMQRVIITYYPDQAPLLASILGVEGIEKVVYQVSELVK